MSKIKFLVVFLFFPLAVLAQLTDVKDSEIISGGISSAKDGIIYWENEKELSGVFCPEPLKVVCLDMQSRCEQQIQKWTAELEFQLLKGSQYVVHSPGYWTAKRYLSWAYTAKEALQLLYDQTRNPLFKTLLDGLNEAIAAAEKIIKLYLDK